MHPYEIPLSAETQKFSIQLGSASYVLRFYWCKYSSCWMLDISDANEVPMLLGIPVVTGIDLLSQYAYLEFGGSLIVQTDHNPDQVPDFAGLGTSGHIYFVTE